MLGVDVAFPFVLRAEGCWAAVRGEGAWKSAVGVGSGVFGLVGVAFCVAGGFHWSDIILWFIWLRLGEFEFSRIGTGVLPACWRRLYTVPYGIVCVLSRLSITIWSWRIECWIDLQAGMHGFLNRREPIHADV